MKRLFKLWGMAAIIAGSLSACETNEPVKKPTDPRGEGYTVGSVAEISDSRAAVLAKGQAAFACDLFAELPYESGNYAISPMSLYMFSGLLVNGADNATESQIVQALRADNVDEIVGMCRRQIDRFKELNENPMYETTVTLEELIANGYSEEEARELLEDFNGSRRLNTEVKLANALWVNSKGGAPYDSYVQECKKWLEADVTPLDFSIPLAATAINQWIAEKTNGLITHIVKELMPINAGIVCTNALYMNAAWRQDFVRGTEPKAFTNIDSSESQVYYLSQWSSLDYAENSVAEMVSIPLGVDRETPFTFYVFLPKTDVTVPAKMLTYSNYSDLIGKAESKYIDLSMPEFEVATEADQVMNGLKALGVTDAFSKENADFKRMGSFKFYVESIAHQVKVHVDEHGIIAGAGTSNDWATDNGKPKPEPYKLTINRPFAWAVADNSTGMILFLGTTGSL